MPAPFKVGGEVKPPYFIGRKKTLDEVVLGMSTLSQNYLIIGPRRTGKSSLLRNIEKQLDKQGDLVIVSINCMEVTTYFELLTTVTKSLLAAYERKHRVSGLIEKFKICLEETILNAIRSIEKIGGSVKDVLEGYISFREKDIDDHELARRTFDFLGDFANEKNVKIVVIFDEFQKTADFNGFLYGLLKSRGDTAENVRYIFSGSSLSVLQQVFLRPKSSLYHMATRIDIGPIDSAEIKKFISRRMKEFNINIEDDALESICNLTSGIPFYFQKIGYICYRDAALDGKKTIKKKNVENAFEEMVAEFSPEFETRFDHSYSPRQQRILKALSAQETMRVSEIAKALDLSVNELGKDMKLLRDSLTIERIKRGTYDIVDGVFKVWLSKGSV